MDSGWPWCEKYRSSGDKGYVFKQFNSWVLYVRWQTLYQMVASACAISLRAIAL